MSIEEELQMIVLAGPGVNARVAERVRLEGRLTRQGILDRLDALAVVYPSDADVIKRIQADIRSVRGVG